MTLTETTLYIIVLVFVVFGMALIAEFYKKTIRKDKSKTWENRFLGFTLSVLSAFGLYSANLIIPILSIFNAPFWANVSFYILAFYYFQRQVDMKLLKKIMKMYTIKVLKKSGLNDAQIQEIENA